MSKQNKQPVELLIPRRDISKQLDQYREDLERLKKVGSKSEAYRVKGRILALEELLLKYGRNINQPQLPKVSLYARLRMFKRRKQAVPTPKTS